MWDVERTNKFDEWWNGLPKGKQGSKALICRIPIHRVLEVHTTDICTNLGYKGDDGLIRFFYAFDPRRIAILLIGGDRMIPQFFRRYVKKVDRLYDEHIETLRKKGLIPWAGTIPLVS